MKTWTEDMGEISGFGGGYEAVCRSMVLAGIKYVDEHPEADFVFKGFKNIYGIVVEQSPAAELLTEAMMDAEVFLNGEKIQDKVRDDCTGAMHHAAVSHVMAYKRLGWEEYCRQLKEREREKNRAASHDLSRARPRVGVGS